MFSPTENRGIALKDTEKLVQAQKSDKDSLLVSSFCRFFLAELIVGGGKSETRSSLFVIVLVFPTATKLRDVKCLHGRDPRTNFHRHKNINAPTGRALVCVKRRRPWDPPENHWQWTSPSCFLSHCEFPLFPFRNEMLADYGTDGRILFSLGGSRTWNRTMAKCVLFWPWRRISY